MTANRYRCSVLLVDDEPDVRDVLQQFLSTELEVVTVDSAEKAHERLAERDFDLVVSDQCLPAASGTSLLEWLRENRPKTVRIMMTGKASLEEAVEAINRGQVHRYVFKPFPPEQLLQILRNAAKSLLLERSHEELLDELRRLNQELEQRVHERTGELESANRELEQKNLILQKMALTDPLTGLPNRRAMDRLARTELAPRSRSPAPLCLGIIDADHFKDVNSRYLHSGGDHTLVWLGNLMAGSVRTIDTIGRVGGEEFMLVAPDTTLEGAKTLGERIRRTVEGSFTTFRDQPIRITVSLGLVVTPADGPVSYELLKHHAAAALGEAKLGGRNRCVAVPLPGLDGQAGWEI